ncbi:hypothetical protein FHR28_001152 [Acinetobacter sp. BIGb0196]|jgi:hypothetical protein|nr:hypothetical protein F981_04189 [Acinetobacter guillouiae CIP 63.46]MCS4300105.1 hypothetical protein [Acinetobacter guillouiae]MCW2251259.1 hypothetical protein [Acinetobacter sp. BIGb0204]NII36243.1 hypothetical protein [Acinetobacter sp. BIGb0196]
MFLLLIIERENLTKEAKFMLFFDISAGVRLLLYKSKRKNILS